MAQRKYMLLYHSYLDDIELLDERERGRLLTACLSYSTTGSVPVLSGNERFVFPHIRAQIDRDAQSYLNVCDKNAQNARKRWDSYKNSVSMRPDANYANDNKNESENDNDIDSENVSDNLYKNTNEKFIQNQSVSASSPSANLSPADFVWRRVRDVLRSEISDVALNTWFDDCFPASWSDGILVIKSPSPLKQATIDEKFMPKIQSIIKSLIASGDIS